MLKDLLIHNLILMESCSLALDPKLNIITGETGAGKTAILHSLKLLLGQKLDTSLIRKGEKKGLIQAYFEPPPTAGLKKLLVEAGISLEDSSLLISREISVEGKSKSFINNHLVSLSFLQKVGSYLVQMIDQHSCQELRRSEFQREIIDQFAALEGKRELFCQKFSALKELSLQQEELVQRLQQRERELSFCLLQLEELQEANLLKEGEEEQLFQEYILAVQTEEASIQTNRIEELLSQGSHSVLSKLAQATSLCKSLMQLHPSFEEATNLFEEASVSLQEVLRLLQNVLSKLDLDPQKKEQLDQKLKKFDQIKRKYGNTHQERNQYFSLLKNKIDRFSLIECEQQDLEEKRRVLSQEVSSLAQELTCLRKAAALKLSTTLFSELQGLNMKGAEISIQVIPQARSATGDDAVAFYLAANPGEQASPIQEGSSGGELARLLLAIHIALAEKKETPTLIFDEIDAGVGGETARLLGEKLKALSQYRQVLCITHFPQVACAADLHVRVVKTTIGDRTKATLQILNLDPSLREEELMRMLGGEKTLSFYGTS